MTKPVSGHKGYLLRDLLSGFVTNEILPEHVLLSGICLDSRVLKEGDVFIALTGTQQNGARFVHEALQKGAVAILHEGTVTDRDFYDMNVNSVPRICIPQLRRLVGEIASRFYSNPSSHMKVAGVTGTDGKTSVSHFIAQALDFSAQTCGLIGTLGNGIYGNLRESTHTTPNPIMLQELLAQLRLHAKYISMEVSSHALDQERVSGVRFDTAVFTNFSRDHLDYHGNMESYWNAKRRLFFTQGLRCAVINISDNKGLSLLSELPNGVYKIAYGIDTPLPANCSDWVIGRNLKLCVDGFELILSIPEGEFNIRCGLLGRFNALNVLAVIAVLRTWGIERTTILNAVSCLTGVPGRMEFFRSAGKPNVVVDYAHTPEALRTVLSALREHAQGKVWCIFGCGGDRDKGKRSMMGEVAEQLADYLILTNDNSRNEDPTKIIANIMQGIRNHENVCTMHDREEAIRFAVTSASLQDVVLVAGKGHEEYQIIGSKKTAYSDRVVVRNLLVSPP